MRRDNVNILNDTLEILDSGYYVFNGKRIPLKLSPAEMREISVYLPEKVQDICNRTDFDHIHKAFSRVEVECENIDSYSLARKRSENTVDFMSESSKPVLVLNLANPVHPGGGVRKGATAQEEDLCRKSSLLISGDSCNTRTAFL